jgi:hypothetical protein
MNMKRSFRKFRDDRFSLTTLENPTIELRSHAELVQAAQRERESLPAVARQPVAPQIPATQEQAAPVPTDAPAAPVTSDAPADPDPSPAALAQLKSGSHESRVEVVQELADLLGVNLTARVPTLPAAEVAPTPHPAPKPPHKAEPKSKSCRKSRGAGLPAAAGTLGCAPPATSTETEAPDEDDFPELTATERHAHKCYICNHPDRAYIEEAFVQWRSPSTIMRCWDIKAKTTIYHRAHALNLFAPRIRNLQYALGNIIENRDYQCFTPRDILHAASSPTSTKKAARSTPPTNPKPYFLRSACPPDRQVYPPQRANPS